MTKTADDAAYDTPYNNIQYTSSTSGGNQIWTATTPILLTGTKANVYAYYPYDPTFTNITAIPINVTENKDVMWVTPATNIYNASPTATLPMNHALSVIRFSLSKGDYSGAGSIESISIQGDCMAKTGTLNAKTGDVIISDAGAEIDFGALGAAATLSTTATTVEQLVIPTTTSGPIKVTIKMDGKTFEATSSTAITPEQSKAYKFGLAFSDSKLTMSTVSIRTIAETQVEDMTPIENSNPWTCFTAENDGVYGIKTDGSPMLYDEASTTSETLSGVAVVLYGRALQISNSGLSGNQVWGDRNVDISGIENLTDIGGGVTGSDGYLPLSDGSYSSSATESTKITSDHTQWPNYSNTALADTAGWSHTEVLIANQSQSTFLGPKTKEFRENSSVNQGYSNWFVPAAGQLAYIMIHNSEINQLLNKCGASQIPEGTHYSSSEYDTDAAWIMQYSNGWVFLWSKNPHNYHVRLCRYITD